MNPVMLEVLQWVVIVVSLAIAATLKTPEWAEDREKWKKVKLYSSFFVLVAWIVFASFGLSFIGAAVSPIVFALAQSAYSDFVYRKVDRRMLWATFSGTFIPAVIHLASANPEALWGYALVLSISSIPYFLKDSSGRKFLGESDTRALMISVLFLFGGFGMAGVNFFLVSVASLLLLYGVFVSLKSKSFSGFGKISVPAVPIILFPALAYPFIALV